MYMSPWMNSCAITFLIQGNSLNTAIGELHAKFLMEPAQGPRGGEEESLPAHMKLSPMVGTGAETDERGAGRGAKHDFQKSLLPPVRQEPFQV